MRQTVHHTFYWVQKAGLLFNGKDSIPLFSFSEAIPRSLALLFSPYRGLFVFAPILLGVVVSAITLRKTFSAIDLIGLAAFAGAFILNAGYSFWTAGHASGPRFLVAPMVLLATIFARGYQRYANTQWWKPLLVLSVFIQVLSILLPSATEDIIREQAQIDHFAVKNAWRCDLSAPCLRPPLALEALRNTIHPSAPHNEKTIFWWPFRLTYQFNYFNPYVAFTLVTFFALLSAAVLRTAWRNAKADDARNRE